MAARRYSVAALAAGLALVLAGCGGSGEPRPDLVLVSTRDGDYAIYALDADGGSQKRLTEADVDASSPRGLLFQIDPAWSPDGRSIAFASKRSGTFDIYVMNADGTGTRRVTSGPEDDGHPTWSPDGGRIAFDRGASGDLYVMSSDGSGVHPIADDPAPENEPAWSPDGRWIAYVRRTPGTEVRELWLVRADGSEQQRLTSLRASSLSPTWSPDGTRIAFASNAVETLYDIFTLTLGKKDARRLTLTGPDAFEPAWSPDGSTIAFSRGGSIFTVDLEGNVEDVTDPDNNDSSPAWNPRLPSATES
jgi:Tol biopolymer transport system component